MTASNARRCRVRPFCPEEGDPRVLARLSVGQKLLASFATVLVLLVALTAVGLAGMGSMDAATHEITGTSTPKLTASLQIRFGAAELAGRQAAYILDRGASRR